MLTCLEARSLISDYVDGDLDPAIERDVDEHLVTCSTCPPLAKALIGLLAELRQLPERPPAEAWLTELLATTLSATTPDRPTHNPGDTPWHS